MSAVLAHRGPDGEDRWIDGSAGLAYQYLRVTPESLAETQPLVARSGAALVFDGRLDNRGEILAQVKASSPVHAGSPDCELVMALYESAGERVAELLAGD